MGSAASLASATIDTGMLSAVVDAAPTPLWVIDADGLVALANQAAVGMLGYRSVGDVIGAPSHDTLHEWRPDGTPYPAHDCPIMDRRSPHQLPDPEWFITRAGQPIPVMWTTRPLGIDGARLLSFADATDRIAAETGAVRSRAELRARLLAHVRDRFRDPDFTAATLAAEFHLSLRSVQQVLAEHGCSPAAEIRRRRLDFASALLTRGTTVQYTARASGFTDAGTFTRAFRRQFGCSPSDWLRRRAGDQSDSSTRFQKAPAAAAISTGCSPLIACEAVDHSST